MTCPICDQKPANCDCTAVERRQFAEIEELNEQIASLRLTDPERDAIRMAQGMFLVEHDLCLADERAGKTPLMPSSYWQGLVDVMHGLRERAG
jgi:hypothetical protein